MVNERNPRPRKYKRHLDSFYINVPRIIRQARLDGLDIQPPADGRVTEMRLLPLHDAMNFRRQVEAYVAGGAFSAVRINKVADWRVPGTISRWAHNFETDGIPDVFTFPQRRALPDGEFGHAIRVVNGWRIWLDIEPRFIFSNSGALMFRPSSGYLTGLATIKNIISRESIVYASPLILGL